MSFHNSIGFFVITVLIAMTIVSIVGNSSKLTGENVCSRNVSKLVYVTKRTTVTGRKCVYVLQNGKRALQCNKTITIKIIRVSQIMYQLEYYCCPGFIEINNKCKPVTTTTITTTATPMTNEMTTEPIVPPPARSLQDDVLIGSPVETAGIGAAVAAAVVVLLIIGVVLIRKKRKNKGDTSSVLNLEDNEKTGYDKELEEPYNPVPNLYDQLHVYDNEQHMYDAPTAEESSFVKSSNRGFPSRSGPKSINVSASKIQNGANNLTYADPQLPKPKTDVLSQIKRFESSHK